MRTDAAFLGAAMTVKSWRGGGDLTARIAAVRRDHRGWPAFRLDGLPEEWFYAGEFDDPSRAVLEGIDDEVVNG